MLPQLRTEHTDIFAVHPQLQTIWPEPYRSEAAEASREDCRSNQVMLIELEGEVIGTTGYFFQPDDPENLYLRWHGVVPAQRGRGHAHVALHLLVAYLRQILPERRHLVELAPANAYGDSVAGFFRSIGFVRQPNTVLYCGEPWWPWWLDLHQLPADFQRRHRGAATGVSQGTGSAG